MITTSSNYSLDALYKKNISWALWGSIIYELLLLVHRSMLFSTMSFSNYGVVVSFLSLVHFISHVADGGATNSIPPLLSYFTHSKRSFNIMFKKYTLAVHIPILILVTVVALYYFNNHATVISIPGKLGFLGFLVVTESARNFLRQFLYTVQATKYVVIVELGLLIVRVAILWTAYFFGHYTLSPLILLYSHVIEMLVCNVLFGALVHKMYNKLPNNFSIRQKDGLETNIFEYSWKSPPTSIGGPEKLSTVKSWIPASAGMTSPSDLNSSYNINFNVSTLSDTTPNDDFIFPPQFFASSVRIKFFNYLLRLSRNLFSSNFLTPLLAVHCGLATAGIFYFASKLAQSLLSVVKITIGYSGNGLLAAAKKESTQTINHTFSRLNKKLFWISAPLMSGFLVATPLVTFVWYSQELQYQIFMLSMLFLFMNIIECFFILYECLFILHHAAHQLFFIKIIEIVLFYIIISCITPAAPYLSLISTFVLRSMTLTFVVIHAQHLLLNNAQSY